MQKQGIRGYRSLEQFKSLSDSVSRTANALSMPSKWTSGSLTTGSFANLKITAEKLVKEQASVKTDLDMAYNLSQADLDENNLKLKKTTEQLRTLEEKLQNAFNENAKLKVKQKEDEKLWKGLDSKFSSTKTLCDQLTETLQLLAVLVQDAEKDKQFFEDNLAARSMALQTLDNRMNGLSSKLESVEEIIRNREKELKELKIQKEERETSYRDETSRLGNLIKEKEAEINQAEVTVADNRLAIENLNSKLGELHFELRTKEASFQNLMIAHENLQKEKGDLLVTNDELENKLVKVLREIEKLTDLVRVLTENLIQLDRKSMDFSVKFDQLETVCGSLIKLLLEERDLVTKLAQKQYKELHECYLHNISEKDALHLVNIELKCKFSELQRVQEFSMVQHTEECHIAEERIRHLESEVETLSSKKTEMEVLVLKLEEKNESLLESSKSYEDKMQDQLQQISALESSNKDNVETLQAKIQEKSEEIDILQKEIGKHVQCIDSLKIQISELDKALVEKEKLIQQHKDGEETLENKKTEIQASLAAAEVKLAEDKKQYDLMLENKQLELSRHLKEISQRNDQAINEIRKKYEVEKLEIVNLEKEKVDRVLKEVEGKCELKLAECRKESNQQLTCIQEEHAALVTCIRQEHDKREQGLKADHCEELRRVQLQAELDLREKIVQLRDEHEVQMRALKHQHDDEYKQLEEELHVQKSREDRQRALLQLQWKVMGNKPQEDQEVNSKKNYSISSIKMKDTTHRTEMEEDSPLQRVRRTPVSNLLKKVEEVDTGKHRRKVTRPEYEFETNNRNTITKRRKTRSTAMDVDPTKPKRMNTPRAKTPRIDVKGIKRLADRSHPSNIGDLFTEGSLNPYADDPYAFD